MMGASCCNFERRVGKRLYVSTLLRMLLTRVRDRLQNKGKDTGHEYVAWQNSESNAFETEHNEIVWAIALSKQRTMRLSRLYQKHKGVTE